MSLLDFASPESTERTLRRRDRTSATPGTAWVSSSGTALSPRYLPILPLQSGGMANIDLAVGSESGNYKKLVVQKTIREEFVSDSSLVAMFLDEARLCARLNHQNLVQVYEVLELPRPCLVMEYMEGLSLASLHQFLGPEFTCNRQLLILSHVLAGLHYAHELSDFDGAPLGIVHRDVSPQNIVITSDGRVKVLDFGIAKTASSPSYTLAGTVKGKLSYMSPEQLAGEPLDRRTDIFAVGCMLWRAASGKKLWSRMSTEDVMSCLVSGRIPSPSIHRSVAPRLEAIVMRALAPARADRHASADELRRDLDGYLAETAKESDLRDWMQTTFAEHWKKERQRVSEAFAEFASIPPVGVDERLSLAAIPADPRRADHRYVKAGLLAAAVAALLIGAAGIKERFATASAVTSTLGIQPSSAAELRVQLRTVPPGAQIAMDSTPLTGNPTEVRVARGSEHAFEVTLANYRTVTRKLRFDAATTVAFELLEEASTVDAPTSAQSSPRTRGAMAPRPSARPAETADATPATPDTSDAVPAYDDPCQPPFYFKNGIKLYKPECLK